jgi:hypothetical protein
MLFIKQRKMQNKPGSNENDTETADTRKRIRLGFNSSNDFHRQVLLGL